MIQDFKRGFCGSGSSRQWSTEAGGKVGRPLSQKTRIRGRNVQLNSFLTDNAASYFADIHKFPKEKNSRQVINLDNRTQNGKTYILSIIIAIFYIFHRCLPLCLILLRLLCPVTKVGALSEAGVRPSVCPSVCLSVPCP